MSAADHDQPIRVFVHLARGFGAVEWSAKWQRGEIIGLNDPLPYGYFHAAEHGCTVEHSEDRPERLVGRLLRIGLRAVLGFDFVHAWRNRRGIRDAEIIWTHTESQHLAVLLLLCGYRRSHRPKVIAQSVWLFDAWRYLSPPKRWLYRRLLGGADMLTVLSPENLKIARALFPRLPSQMVLFGVAADAMKPRLQRPAHRPLRILSLGNDRHRDWPTLVGAIGDRDDCELCIVTPRLPAALTRAENVRVVHPKNNAELAELYEWADLVALALTPNKHASGITVVAEATVFGVPVICTDTGGLQAYFAEGDIRYVPAGQPAAMRQVIGALADDDDARCSMVERARRRMCEAGLTSRDYARRYAHLSKELLREQAPSGLRQQRHTLGSSGLALGCATALAGALLLMAGAHAAMPVIDPCRLRPTFTDDFNTLSVSTFGETAGRWFAHTPWNGDFGDAAFTDPRPDFPFRVQDGVLDIEARKNADGKWQSGLIASAMPDNGGFAQRYGYFEMRAQLPPGPGTWPGFWLNANQPKNDPRPGVELDVIEYYGQFPDAYHSAVHVWNKADPKKSTVEDHVTAVPSGSLTSEFHIYGVDVEPDFITFYLDRSETWRVATPPELRDPLMMLVDLALGSGWPIDKTPNPSVMKVDYVHVFAPPSEGAAPGGGCHD
ncbi:MAG TPA: family 16 glycosylhydrolase [Stellaceae bacterium]|jgi:glycosyltransferase involved in cell wall biosynthesis|nr:family 16 glycosylhydrolase [Stellaceae bacterium]